MCSCVHFPSKHKSSIHFWNDFSILFFSTLFYFFSVQLCQCAVSSSVECVVNVVTSAHCSRISVPGCSYWLLFSPTDFPSVFESLRTAELNDKLLLHTSPLCTTTHCSVEAWSSSSHKPPARAMNSFFNAFSILCVCLVFHRSRINLCVWRSKLVLLFGTKLPQKISHAKRHIGLPMLAFCRYIYIFICTCSLIYAAGLCQLAMESSVGDWRDDWQKCFFYPTSSEVVCRECELKTE